MFDCSGKAGGYTTLAEHMPATHVYHRQTFTWDREYFNAIARKAGTASEGESLRRK